MTDCIFCGSLVGGDEGGLGKQIGKQSICEPCLTQLKEALEELD